MSVLDLTMICTGVSINAITFVIALLVGVSLKLKTRCDKCGSQKTI